MSGIFEVWVMIEKLAALAATEGVSEEIKKLANAEIEKLLHNVILPEAKELSANYSGIITK